MREEEERPVGHDSPRARAGSFNRSSACVSSTSKWPTAPANILELAGGSLEGTPPEPRAQTLRGAPPGLVGEPHGTQPKRQRRALSRSALQRAWCSPAAGAGAPTPPPLLPPLTDGFWQARGHHRRRPCRQHAWRAPAGCRLGRALWQPQRPQPKADRRSEAAGRRPGRHSPCRRGVGQPGRGRQRRRHPGRARRRAGQRCGLRRVCALAGAVCGGPSGPRRHQSAGCRHQCGGLAARPLICRGAGRVLARQATAWA